MANFTLTDVTKTTWTTLSNPPDGTATPTEPSALCLKDTKTCMKETADRAKLKGYFARNSDWNPRPLPSITSPISWPFTKNPLFKKSGFATFEVFDLAFVAAPPAGYTVKIYSVAFKAGKELPPRFIAVAFPADIDISKLPAFLVHFKHIPGQDPSKPYFKYFTPFGWDWLFYEIWGWLNFTAMSVTGGTLVDMPFVSLQQYSFGFTYQLRQANKPYVIVLPQISRITNAANGKLQDYQLYSAEMLRDILIEIQKDILSLKDEKLNTVAISANSSGCNILTSFLSDNIAAMKNNKVIAEFMNDELNEIFILDPPQKFGDAMVNGLLPWRKLTSSRDAKLKKCIRFYTNGHTKNFASLTDNGKDPFTAGTHGFWQSSNNATSLAYLPFSSTGDDIWQRTHDEYITSNFDLVNNHAFVHHAIPALFLTDAARRSLFV